MKRLKHIAKFFTSVAPELGGGGLFASLDELTEQRKYVAYLRRLSQEKTLSNMAGDVKSAFKGRGMELEEIRSYAYGDDVRDIDWRVTARKGQPRRFCAPAPRSTRHSRAPASPARNPPCSQRRRAPRRRCRRFVRPRR